MCFNPQVDVVAGVAIAAVAVDALRHCPSPRYAPLAALPAIFAIHTFLDAAVWWGLLGSVPTDVGAAATMWYIAIAYVVLPVLVPLSVLLITNPGWRRNAQALLVLCGLAAAGAFLVGLTAGRGTATACPAYIDYDIAGVSAWAGILYAVATCGAFLLSGRRPLVLWGVANVLAVAVLAMWVGNGLPSLWCFWAACTSVFAAWLMRQQQPGDQGVHESVSVGDRLYHDP